MQRTFNATLVGHIGQDAKVNQVQNRYATQISVAESHKYKNKADGQIVEKTTWHNVTIWTDDHPKIAQYLKKGSLVHIQGTPSARAWESKKNPGQLGANLEWSIFQNQIRLLISTANNSSNGSNENQNQNTSTQTQSQQEEPVNVEYDLPF